LPKLPAVKPREVIQFLEPNGFVLDHASGSYSIYYHALSKRRAVVPKHNRDVPKGTLVSLLREAGFSREDLIDFSAGKIECLA
jgi:predicted RNA binding protein YcfA (HicA-like mRNA interferase family)